MDEQHLNDLVTYVDAHFGHLEKFMRPLIDPEGKRILVIGSGWGTETYWSLKNGATSVVGVDPGLRSTEPLERLLTREGISIDRFSHHEATLQDLSVDEVGTFDAIISNNVFEHIFDLTGVLAGCASFIPQRGGRIAIFADPLYFSSAGAHLPVGPWHHLSRSHLELREEAGTAANWGQYSHGLNGMTLTTFLEAVRQAGLWIEHLGIVPDRHRSSFNKHVGELPPGLKPMDLLVEGVSCRLAFPHNL